MGVTVGVFVGVSVFVDVGVLVGVDVGVKVGVFVGVGTEATVNLWRSTSAITSITIQRDTGNLNTGMTLTLYGIAAA